MTEMQLFTVCLSIMIPLSMLLYSNSRISDAKETLRSESNLGFERVSRQIDQLRADMNSKLADMNSKFDSFRGDMNIGFEKLDRKIEKHELEHHAHR